MARKRKGRREPIIRSSGFRQIMVDHVWAVEEKTHMRLTIGTNVISGTHDHATPEVLADAELILAPEAIEQIEEHIKDWKKLQTKGRKR